MESSKLLHEAIKYSELGFSVFPAQGKLPLIPWEKYQKEKPSKEQIIEWWTKYPEANIAIATGAISGVVIVDIDGVEIPPGLSVTPTVQTSPGRYHYYFLHPGFNVPNSTGVMAQGVDIRGDGGLVIVPPSQHFDKATKKPDFKYTWLIPLSEKFAPLPDWVLEKIKIKKPLEAIANGSSEGQRNENAASIAGSLLAKYSQNEWESICWPLLQGWNKNNNPILKEKELRSVFDSISKKEASKKKPENATETKTSPAINPEILSKSLTLNEVLSQVEAILPGKRELLLLAMATSISHLVDPKTPLWLMFVGVPSSAKTEVARMLSFYPHAFFLDTLTENAFISGAKNKNGSDPTDLLPLLNGKCFVIKDFTTTLSQREESVKKILGDLTSIYDDSFAKHSPSRGTVYYHSYFSILGCVTPQALNRHQRYMNQIGPRFLFYRVPNSNEDQVNQSLEILWSHKDSKPLFKLAQEKVSAYCLQLSEKLDSIALEREDNQAITYLNSLAKFIAQARGMVLTRVAEFQNAEGDKISFYEPIEVQIEEPFRALQQMRALARSLAIVMHKNAVGMEQLELVRKVALSSMPADRALLISVIAREDRPWSAKDIADNLGISHKTALRQMDELVSLKVLSKTIQGSGLANLYSVNLSFHSVIYTTEEFMSHPETTGTETPHRGNNSVTNEAKTTINSLPGLEGYGQKYH